MQQFLTYLNPFIDLLKSYTWLGNSFWNYVLAVLIFLGTLIVLYLFRTIILVYLRHLSKKTKNNLDDMLVDIFTHVGKMAYPALGLYLGLRYLTIADIADKTISVLFVLVLAYEALKALKSIFNFYVTNYLNKYNNEGEKQGSRSVMNIIWVIIVIIFWSIVLLAVMSNLGINVTSLIASLGIGGIAIALAVQNVLSDLLSSFSIYLDKPFTVGDYIEVGTDKGTVEKIGLKTTRLRSLTGQELIISNKELTSVRINNYRRMERRRDSFDIGVTYGTSQAKLDKIPQIIKTAVDKVDELEFLRCRFVEFGDFSLNYSIVFYVNAPDINVFLEAKEKVLLEIYNQFNKEKIDFAYPTQEVIVKK